MAPAEDTALGQHLPSRLDLGWWRRVIPLPYLLGDLSTPICKIGCSSSSVQGFWGGEVNEMADGRCLAPSLFIMLAVIIKGVTAPSILG